MCYRSCSILVWLVIALGAGSLRPAILMAQSSTAQGFVQQGIDAFQRHDFQKAVEAFTEALRRDPNHAIAYYNRCAARYKLDDTQRALEDCTQAFRLDPHYAEAYYLRGLMRSEKLGDNKGAISDFDQAVQVKPDYAAAYLKRGNARYRLGDQQGGLADYAQAIRLAPDDADAYFNRGVVRAKMGEKDAALADLRDAAQRYKAQGDNVGYQRATDAVQKVSGK